MATGELTQISWDSIRAVFIDLDGTLADSLGLFYQVYERLASELGIEPTREEFQRLTGPTIPEIALYLKENYDVQLSAEGLSEQYHSYVAEAYQSAELFPHAIETLGLLKERGITLWLVTSAPKRFAQSFAEARGFAPLLSDVITPEGLSAGKPAPAVYREALSAADCEAADCVALEDSANGLKAAMDAGIPTVLMHAGAGTPESLPEDSRFLGYVESWEPLKRSLQQ